MSNAKTILAIFLATAWIGFSEFARNNLLFKSLWIDHYKGLGLVFPDQAINGAFWGVWSLLFAIAVYIIASKFSLLQTTLIAWLMAFVMMWVVIGNLSVLPYRILWFAVPLSLLETFVAVWIIHIFKTRNES